MNNRLPGSSVPGILQARIPAWVAMSSFRNLPDPEIEPAGLMSPALADCSSPLMPPGKHSKRDIAIQKYFLSPYYMPAIVWSAKEMIENKNIE